MNSIQKLFHHPTQTLRHVLELLWPEAKSAPEPALDLDQISAEGLRLREAISVRSAEFWLVLGEPGLALRELEALTELAKQSAWVRQVQEHAVNAQQVLDL